MIVYGDATILCCCVEHSCSVCIIRLDVLTHTKHWRHHTQSMLVQVIQKGREEERKISFFFLTSNQAITTQTHRECGLGAVISLTLIIPVYTWSRFQGRVQHQVCLPY